MTTYLERPKRGGGNEASLDGGATWRRLMPCLMSAPGNAQKCFDETKTQTRRIIKQRTRWDQERQCRWPVGTILWIQEPWRVISQWTQARPTQLPNETHVWYEALNRSATQDNRISKLRPARFMPLRFSRPARYEVIAVKFERVNEISEADALAEGVTPDLGTNKKWHTLKMGFRKLWNSIHSKPGTRFEDAPWVFVYEFRRIK